MWWMFSCQRKVGSSLLEKVKSRANLLNIIWRGMILLKRSTNKIAIDMLKERKIGGCAIIKLDGSCWRCVISCAYTLNYFSILEWNIIGAGITEV